MRAGLARLDVPTREQRLRVFARGPDSRHLRHGHPTRPAAAAARRSASPPPLACQPAPASDPISDLRAWIEEHGGAILPGLSVVEDAPCGCRGVVATEPLPQELLERTPLIIVPERLYMSTDAAGQLLSGLGAKRFGLSWFDRQLPGHLQLALLLAAERNKGDGSFWAPYIRALPHEVPCGWALGKSELGAALAALGPSAAGTKWAAAAEAARVGVRRQAEAAVQRYGRHLGVGVEDVVWAVGQVQSRSFGRDPRIGLAPFIDLCNHRYGAPRPAGYADEQDGQTYAYLESTHFGETRELAAGDEVYLSYGGDGGDPLATFLNLGFVPPEMLTDSSASGPRITRITTSGRFENKK